VVDKVLAFHRKVEGADALESDQLSRTLKLANRFLNAHRIGYALASDYCNTAYPWKQLFMFVWSVLGGVVDSALRVPRGLPHKYKAKFESVWAAGVQHWLAYSPLTWGDLEQLQPGLHDRIIQYGQSQQKLDLTVVMPCHNVGHYIGSIISQMLRSLKVSFEIFLINDHSKDDTWDVILRYDRLHPNVYAINSERFGAGFARNVAYPMLGGDYVIFLDGDDLFDFTELSLAVSDAQERNLDVLMLPFKLASTEVDGVLQAEDVAANAWEEAASEPERVKQVAFKLTNYPWIQLTRTQVLLERGVFFGPTKVHNDILFHWHSIMVSDRIAFYAGGAICTHRHLAQRHVLTNLHTAARMQLFDAINQTFRVLDREGFFWVDDYVPIWFTFIANVYHFFAPSVPDELQDEFRRRRESADEAAIAAQREAATRAMQRQSRATIMRRQTCQARMRSSAVPLSTLKVPRRRLFLMLGSLMLITFMLGVAAMLAWTDKANAGSL